jgi:hypothetical protein
MFGCLMFFAASSLCFPASSVLGFLISEHTDAGNQEERRKSLQHYVMQLSISALKFLLNPSPPLSPFAFENLKASVCVCVCCMCSCIASQTRTHSTITLFDSEVGEREIKFAEYYGAMWGVLCTFTYYAKCSHSGLKCLEFSASIPVVQPV